MVDDNFVAMIFETIFSIASPWPLKIIIDNVIMEKALPSGLAWLDNFIPRENYMALAAASGIFLVMITAFGGFAGYINNYYSENVSQYIARDRRQRTYHHLQRLSLAYYDNHQVGKLVSTITTVLTQSRILFHPPC